MAGTQDANVAAREAGEPRDVMLGLHMRICFKHMLWRLQTNASFWAPGESAAAPPEVGAPEGGDRGGGGAVGRQWASRRIGRPRPEGPG